MRFLYHHRTRGLGVEAVHICGIVEGLEAIGHTVALIGPPGVDVDRGHEAVGPRDSTPRAKTSWKRRAWDRFVRSCPGSLFELIEAGYSLAALPRLLAAGQRVRPHAIYERYAYFNAGGLLAARTLNVPL